MTYARDYNEVKDVGAVESHPASPACPAPETTDLARFWSGGFIAELNAAVRGIAISEQLSIGDAAWTPFFQGAHFPAGIQTPPYADYVSGANGVTGALGNGLQEPAPAQVARRLLRDPQVRASRVRGVSRHEGI